MHIETICEGRSEEQLLVAFCMHRCYHIRSVLIIYLLLYCHFRSGVFSFHVLLSSGVLCRSICACNAPMMMMMAYPWVFLNLKIYCCLGSTLGSFFFNFNPKFLDVQVSRFPNSQIKAWAGLGPAGAPSAAPPRQQSW